MKLLVVEDDEFKASDLIKALEETIPEADVIRAASVTSALRLISSSHFDLCILDMSLPTFDLSGPGGGGTPQSQGGLEVLRLAKRLNNPPPFVVVTQYPDIEIGGREISLRDAAEKLSTQFQVRLRGCVLYEFDSLTWKSELTSLIAK